MTQINLGAIDAIAESSTTVKDWTLMFYLAGDNNLSENMAYSLESLGRAAAALSDDERARINLLAFFNGSSLTAPTMYLDFSDVRSGNGPLRQPALGDQAEPADALLNFIGWCTADEEGRGRKARNYALILSGHSLGFHGNTFLRNESSGKYFTLSSMRQALEQANDRYLNNGTDGRIAILGFDSCVMSMIEVGHEFKDVARTLIASEGSLPNSGWGYAPMLSSFVAALAGDRREELQVDPVSGDADRKAEIHTAAKSFVRSFTHFYTDIAIGGGSIDISAWDLERVQPLTSAVDRLGSELDLVLAKPENPGFHELKKMILQSHYASQTYMADQYVDLKDLCQQLIEECRRTEPLFFSSPFDGVRRSCEEVIEAVDDCVLKCGFSGDAYQFSNGISIFFPWSSVAFAAADARYRTLRFVCGEDGHASDRTGRPGGGWYSFLLNYVGNITVRKARKRAKNSAFKTNWYDSIVNIPTGAPEAANVITKNGLSGSDTRPFSGRDFTPLAKDAPPLAKDVSPLAKDAPPLAKDVPPLTKDAPPLAKDAPPLAKDVSLLSRGMSENGDYLFHFRRFKNYELGWNISGFADDDAED